LNSNKKRRSNIVPWILYTKKNIPVGWQREIFYITDLRFSSTVKPFSTGPKVSMINEYCPWKFEIKIIKDPKHPCYKQRGVFSKSEIPKNTCIGHYAGLVLEKTQTEGKRSAYLFCLTEKLDIDSSKFGNEFRYTNDPLGTDMEANVIFVALDGRVLVFTTKEIKSGDELLVKYGQDYWDEVDESEVEIEE